MNSKYLPNMKMYKQIALNLSNFTLFRIQIRSGLELVSSEVTTDASTVLLWSKTTAGQ